MLVLKDSYRQYSFTLRNALDAQFHNLFVLSSKPGLALNDGKDSPTYC